MELKSFSKSQSEGSAACQGQVTPTEKYLPGVEGEWATSAGRGGITHVNKWFLRK